MDVLLPVWLPADLMLFSSTTWEDNCRKVAYIEHFEPDVETLQRFHYAN